MVYNYSFPQLDYDESMNTRRAVHSYSKLLGAIRASMTPEQKDYWHISLRSGPQGFRTTPIAQSEGNTFEITLNLISHNIFISSLTGQNINIPIRGQSVCSLSGELLAALDSIGIKPHIDLAKFQDESQFEYRKDIASEIFRSYSMVDIIFKKFKGTLKQETSPCQLWPHHMDIAFTCYPRSESNKIGQVGFGYLTGDETIEEPYFYITAYPEIEDISDIELNDGAYWNKEGWQGVVMKYTDLIKSESPAENLFRHLQMTFEQIIKKA